MKGTEEYDKRFRDTKGSRPATAKRQKPRKAPPLASLSDAVIEFEARMVMARCEALLKINE